MVTPLERFEQRIAAVGRPMAQHLDLNFKSNPFRSMDKRFAIACSARTGSYLLCEKLLDHGAVATECFVPNRVVGTSAKRGYESLEEYCLEHLAGHVVNGIFAIKGPFPILATLALAGELPGHAGDWQFVHLVRKDKLKQAISFVIAQETLAWRSFKAPIRAMTDDDYDAARIAKTIKAFEALNRVWDQTFTLFGVDPMRITYEDLAADPDGVSAAVAGYLGLNGPPITAKRFVSPPVEVQSTDLNARWEARFLEERRKG